MTLRRGCGEGTPSRTAPTVGSKRPHDARTIARARTTWSLAALSTGGRAAALSVGLAATLSTGCADPAEATIVALPGCGLEGEVLTGLRIRVRGDFPGGASEQLRAEDGRPRLDLDTAGADAITVEGLFGDAVSGVGRSARLREEGEIPVYFSGVDRLCAVPSPVAFRQPDAMAVGPQGDVVVVGGRDLDGDYLDEVVHLRDEEGVPRVLAASLPVASAGQTVHAVDDRAFLVVGGSGSESASLDTMVRVELSEEGEASVRAPVRIELDAGSGRAHHAAVSLPDGRIFVTGGCAVTRSDGECEPTLASVLSTSLVIDGSVHPPSVRRGPDLPDPRYAGVLLVARDGLLIHVGGRNPDGEPLLHALATRAEGSSWESYGPSLAPELPVDVAIEGATLLEGGLIVVATSDGRLRWINVTSSGVVPGWCDPTTPDGPCFTGPAPAGRRPLATLPGERVVADAWLVPVASLSQTGASAIDLSVPPPGSSVPPPSQRAGAIFAPLADGTLLLAGGREPSTQEPVLPLLLRLRPALDGPDERIPGVESLAPGSLIAHQPDRVDLEEGRLRLLSAGIVEEFPSVRAHVRGFRSAAFRFEVTLSAVDAQPHLVLTHGALQAVSIRFGPDRVHGYQRAPSGVIQAVICGSAVPDFSSPQRLEAEVRPDSIVVAQGDTIVAQCPGPGEDVPLAVGLGASGSGTVNATGLRLTRI